VVRVQGMVKSPAGVGGSNVPGGEHRAVRRSGQSGRSRYSDIPASAKTAIPRWRPCTLDARLFTHDPVDLFGFPVADGRDEHQIGRKDQDTEGDQNHPAAFGPLCSDLTDKNEAGKLWQRTRLKAPQERLATFRKVFRICWRMAKPIIMIGMNTPMP